MSSGQIDEADTPPSMPAEEESSETAAAENRRIMRIVRRDASFLAVAVVATMATSYVELNAGDASLRGASGAADKRGIVDAGFVATASLHSWLVEHRGWNDALAMLNTLLCVLLPALYLAHVTIWVGDYDLPFRYFAAQILRSVCGWLTYLPSSPDYLMSYNDIPHIWQRQIKQSESADDRPFDAAEPFVSFFSGHVATMIICANHMYLHGHRRLGVLCHVLNALQVVRLLATRGHYSIDIIIAFYVASHLSRSAGRLGWYYSRGRTFWDWIPSTMGEALERAVGIEGERRSLRYLRLIEKEKVQQALLDLEEEELDAIWGSVLETTARLAAEGKLMPRRSNHSDRSSSSRKEKKG